MSGASLKGLLGLVVMPMAAVSMAAVSMAATPVVVPVVVVPDRPTAVERSAAGELAGELGKVLGQPLKIVAESQVKARPRLYVGATKSAKAARDGYVATAPSPSQSIAEWKTDEVFLKSVPDGVVLDGDPARAPLYAVDLYLEKYCGVRWWTSTAAHYPKLESAPLANINLSYAPQFKYRETYYLDGFEPKFKVRSKGNFTSRTRYLLSKLDHVPSELGGDHKLYFFKGRRSAYHSFFEVLPPRKYFKAHPEWYSLIGGKRVAKQLCLANAEMKAEYIRETLKRLEEDSSVDFIQVSQNDGDGCCECGHCRAMMAEDGGTASGPYLRFANDVAAAVEAKFPHVRIDTFAYQFTRQAPTKTRPRHNVVVRLCDIECDFARPLAAAPRKGRDDNAAFVRDLKAWQKVARGNLFIWDYLADFTSYMMPHPNLYAIAPNIRLFAKNGAVGVFEQGDALCSAGSFAGLRHYLASHLLWNPADDERQLIDEFLVGYYGKSAAPMLRKFLDLLDHGAKAKQMKIGCYHPGAPFWDVAEKLDAAELMDAAEAAAKTEGEEYAKRVRIERLSVDHYLLLNYDILKAAATKRVPPAGRTTSVSSARAWRRPASRAQAVEQWIAEVKEAGVRAVHETTDAKAIEKYFKQLR